MQNKKRMNEREKSVGLLSIKKTLAQQNLVSMKQSAESYFTCKPLRIKLPDYFNIPKFVDKKLQYFSSQIQNQKQYLKINAEKGLKQKLKDLMLLAQGMKRAKNIKQQSRYYFIQGVLLHNAHMYGKSVEMFQKFLKIVLFIKDDKSIELALNSIGIAFMYMNNLQNAKQYHRKQFQFNQNSQKFIGVINLGLCFQIENNKLEALNCYSSLQNQKTIMNLNTKKLQFLKKLTERVYSYQYTSSYLTQNSSYIKNKKHQSDCKCGSNIFKNLMKKSSSQKQYQSAKINYAISSAQQNISDFIVQVKHSLKESS